MRYFLITLLFIFGCATAQAPAPATIAEPIEIEFVLTGCEQVGEKLISCEFKIKHGGKCAGTTKFLIEVPMQ